MEKMVEGFITSFVQFISVVEENSSRLDNLQNQNDELRALVQSMKIEHEQSTSQISKYASDIQDLNKQLAMANMKRREHADSVANGMVSQNQVVKVKYEASVPVEFGT